MTDMLFLQLLVVSVTTGVIVLLIKAASDKLNKFYTAKWKYWLWLVLAVRLLIPWSPTLPIQPIEIVIEEEQNTEEDIAQNISNHGDVFMSAGEVSLGQNVGEGAVAGNVVQNVGEGTLADNIGQSVGEATSVESVAQNTNQMVQDAGAGLLPENKVSKEVSHLFWTDILHIAERIWLAGMVLYLTYHILCNIVFQRKVLRWSEKAEDALWKQLQAAMGDERELQGLTVLRNQQISSPMILGLFRTKLILPDKEYTREELNFVLRHELTHYRRRDLWYKVLLLVVNAIHWFNPCVHLMCREADADLERSCDSLVMQGAAESERRHYANMVLDTVAEQGDGRHILTSSLHGGKEELRKRLLNILDNGKKRKGVVLFTAIVALVLLISGLVHLSTGKDAGKAEHLEENSRRESTEHFDETENPEERETYNWYTHKSPMYTISEAELGLEQAAVYMGYEEASSKGVVVKYEGAHNLDSDTGSIGEGGTLPGLGEGDWYCVTVDGIEYIYAKYDHREEYELFAYAITGEDVVLENGLYVGMTREQVQQLCPGILDVKLDYEENIDIGWNGIAYPACWVNAYEYAMIIKVDDGIEDNPDVFLALMMQEDVVCAMTPYAPRTDRTVVPLKSGEVKEDAYILQKENLDVDGDGVAGDKLSLHRELQGYEAHNVLTVELDSGLSAMMKLPSKQVYFNDKGTCEIIPNLQKQGRNSIVLVLQDAHGNYGAADYYVLHVEKNAENDAITLEMDCVIVDSELMPGEYKYLEKLQLELPFACSTYYGYPLGYYHEELSKNTLRINALTKGDMQETSVCIYWEDDAWKILKHPTKVVLYEEIYPDMADRAWDVQVPGEDDGATHIYKAVTISNVTDTSFDFEVIRRNYETEEIETVIPLSTAYFEEDFVHATAQVQGKTLRFDFSENTNSFPVVVFFTVSGHESLEGITFFCENIPGFESN